MAVGVLFDDYQHLLHDGSGATGELRGTMNGSNVLTVTTKEQKNNALEGANRR